MARSVDGRRYPAVAAAGRWRRRAVRHRAREGAAPGAAGGEVVRREVGRVAAVLFCVLVAIVFGLFAGVFLIGGIPAGAAHLAVLAMFAGPVILVGGVLIG